MAHTDSLLTSWRLWFHSWIRLYNPMMISATSYVTRSTVVVTVALWSLQVPACILLSSDSPLWECASTLKSFCSEELCNFSVVKTTIRWWSVWIRSRGPSRWCWRAGRTEGRPGGSTSQLGSCWSPAGPRSPSWSAGGAGGCLPPAASQTSGWAWWWGQSSWRRACARTASAPCRCRGSSRQRPSPGWPWRWTGSKAEEERKSESPNRTFWNIWAHLELLIHTGSSI